MPESNADDRSLGLSDEWLEQAGFKWHQLDRRPTKQWLLWLGDAMLEDWHTFEDLGIEVSLCDSGAGIDEARWNCWLRSDTAHRYSRFIHIRRIFTRAELILMIEGLTGQAWNPANHIYGVLRTPEQAARIRKEQERLDLRLQAARPKWSGVEKDDSRGQALPEHYEDYEQRRGRV